MSSDSDGPKNDPLFERLFAEAEACLDKTKAKTVTQTGTDEDDSESIKEAKTADSTTSQHGKKAVKPPRGMTDSGQLSLRTDSSRRAPSRLNRAQSKPDDDALALAEQQVQKLKARLSTAKDRSKRDLELELSKQKDKMLREFLTLLDDLERALSSSIDEGALNAQFESYRKGIQQVYEGGLQLLSQFGVERFDSDGDIFDPNLHEAVRREPRGDMEPNRVVEVFQTGYMIDARLLRAARVSVSASEN